MEYLVATFHLTCQTDMLQTARDIVASLAADAGFEAFEDTDDGLRGYVQKELIDKDALTQTMHDFPLPGCTVSYDLHDVEDRDWNETWEASGFEPINIEGRVVIIDEKQRQQAHDTSNELPADSPGHARTIPIYIQARQAFGTGTHETTRLVISTLLAIPTLKGKAVLDCGCGTGILGIAASKFGAKEVAAFDIDQWSVENARLNAQLNGVENLTVYHGDATVLNHISGVFDVVMANINRNILLHDLEAYRSVMTHGGTLIISGFYIADASMLIEKTQSLGLRAVATRQQNDWCCLCFCLE